MESECICSMHAGVVMHGSDRTVTQIERPCGVVIQVA